jgi:membrane protein YqaA with SNARE-associated domain
VARFIRWLTAVLLLAGPFGFFLAAFLDSSFLSLFEVTDFLVVREAVKEPRGVWLAVLALSLGSLAGCSVLFWLGRNGGDALIVRRFGPKKLESARAAFERWEVLSIAVPAALPPPAPLKLFVFAAGVFGCRYRRFAASVFLARALRYSVWAALGILYGRRTVELLAGFEAFSLRHLPVLILVGGLLVLSPFFVSLLRRAKPLGTDSLL